MRGRLDGGEGERIAALLHDLRTPLNQIIGLAEMLLEIAEEDGHRDLLEGLHSMRDGGMELAGLLADREALTLATQPGQAYWPLGHAVRAAASRILGYADLVVAEEGNPRLNGYRADLEHIRGAARHFLDLVRRSGLSICLDTSRPGAAPSLAPAGPSSGGLDGRVLVVDDENLNREVVCRRLRREGCHATGARSGPEALQLLRAEAYDAILLDMQMPEMSGLEVLQALKCDPNLRQLPVIMLSAHTEVERVARCLELGADDYLPKPVNSTLLRARLGACLEKKKMAEELFRAGKLQSIGVLAGGLAHEFNNMLTMVLGNLSLLRYRRELSPDGIISLEEAENGARRAQELTRYLLTFAEGGAPVKERLDPRKVAEEIAVKALRDLERTAELDFPADLWPLEADPHQFAQVIENLLDNAVEATGPGATIKIDLANVAGPLPSLKLAGENYLRLTVRDRGVGIAPAHLPRVFDPFFTTKEQARGLGLASVYSIVQRHGGHIQLDSSPGEGTTATIHFPATAPKPEPVKESAPSSDAHMLENPDSEPRRKRVLVLDDEEAIRELARAMLEIIGYNVVTAENGEEALAAHEQAVREGRPFDFAIMDLTIPGGMGGAETIKHLRERDTTLRAIVASGYSNDPIMANHNDYGFNGVLPKPYVINDLIRVLGEVSATPSGR